MEANLLGASKVARNVAGLFILQLSARGLSVVWSFYLARKLGPQSYGLWANILTLVGILGVMQGFGTLGIVIRDVSQNPERSRSYYGTSFVIYLISAVCIFFLTILSSLLLHYSGEKISLAIVAALSFFALAPGFASQSILYGHEKFVLYSSIYNLGTVLYIILGILSIQFGFGVLGIFCSLNLAYLVTSLILLWKTISQYGTPTFKEVTYSGWNLFRLGLPLTLSTIFTEIMLRADRILINHFSGEASVGYYHVAFNLVILPREIFFIPLVTAVFTRLCSSYSQDRESFKKLFEKIHIIFLIGTLPILSFFMIFPELIIQFCYGSDFKKTAEILPVLVWMLPPLFISTIWQNIFIIQNRTSMILWINGIGTIFNLLFNYEFIPRWGVIASAISAVFTQGIILVSILLFLKHEKILHFSRSIIKLLGSFIICTGVFYFLKPAGPVTHWAFFFLLLLGLVLYFLIFYLFGILKRDDIDLLKRQLSFLHLPVKTIFQTVLRGNFTE